MNAEVPPLMLPGLRMKTTALLALLSLLAMAMAGCSAGASADKTFLVNQYDVLAALSEDGSAVVTETFEFEMKQRRQAFEFNVNYGDAGSIEFQKVAIAAGKDSGGNEQYIEVQNTAATGNQSSSSSYELQDDGSKMRIIVNVLSEAGSTRQIRLSYRLPRAVVRNSDNALLEQAFFTRIETSNVIRTSLAIQLPVAMTDIATWYLPVSMTDYTHSRPQDDLIAFSGQPSPGQQAMTLYCLMPVDSFAGAAVSQPDKTWDILTAEARQAADALKIEHSAKSSVYYLVFILLALSTILILIIYWLYDRENVAVFRNRYLQRLPAGSRPAVLALLMHRDRPGRLMLSTLLDLVRRGSLKLHGNVFSLPAGDIRDYSGFAAYEVFLVQWLFDHIARDTMISTAEIRRFARDQAAAGEMHAYYAQFRRLIDEEIERGGLIDLWHVRRGRIVASAASLVYLLLTIGSIIFLRDSISLLLLIPTVFLGAYAWNIRRLTPAGRELYVAAQALRRTIRDYDGENVAMDASFFRDMIPLAIMLDGCERLIDNLLEAGQDSSDPFADFRLGLYGIEPSARPWRDQVLALRADFKIMDSMLAASLLLSSDH